MVLSLTGSGNPGYKADVLLNGGIIEKIAETIEEGRSRNH